MGDIADMMLDGTLCQGCGEYLDRIGGFPQFCVSCQAQQSIDVHGRPDFGVETKPAYVPDPINIHCPDCGRKVKRVGLADHRRDSHGVRNQCT